MKVWEWAERTRIEEGNPAVEVIVEKEELMVKFGQSLYDGYRNEMIRFAGINGRLGDVPAFLGGCDIETIELYSLKSGEMKYTIYL